MANGATRLAEAAMVNDGESATSENDTMKSIYDSGKLPKQSLKASASSHNHSDESLHSRK